MRTDNTGTINFTSSFGLQPAAGVLTSSRCTELDFCEKKEKSSGGTALVEDIFKNWFMLSLRISSLWMHAGSLESTKEALRVARGAAESNSSFFFQLS